MFNCLFCNALLNDDFIFYTESCIKNEICKKAEVDYYFTNNQLRAIDFYCQFNDIEYIVSYHSNMIKIELRHGDLHFTIPNKDFKPIITPSNFQEKIAKLITFI